jgi:hypothetical protein
MIKKGGGTVIKPKIGDQIKFKYISNFTGKELIVAGMIIGKEGAVRKMWPDEMGMAEGCYLVRRKDNFGNTYHHAVFPEEITLIKKNKREV